MPYRMSFTSASLLSRESVIIAQAYRETGDWQKAREECLSRNLLQAKKPSSATRTVRELIGRLKTLTADQLELLLNGSHIEQLHMLWLAVAKRYRFIQEFSEEVIREKYLKLDTLVGYDDFDSFFNAKADWDTGLDRLSDSTRKKIRQVLFRMLHEAEILTSGNMIIPALFIKDTVRVIQSDDVAWFAIYPVSDRDIQEWGK